MQNTPHYEIPLPNPDGDLENDVIRLREALLLVDELVFSVQQKLTQTHAERLKWDGSPMANPASGRASLQLGSAAVRPATDFATAYQGGLAETAYAERFNWNGGPLANPAAGRASLQLASAATRPATDFATAYQGGLAETAVQPGDVALPASMVITYLQDSRTDSVTEIIDGKTTTKKLNYNPDGTIHSVIITSEKIIRTEVLNYSNGQLVGMTATEEVKP